VNSTSLEIELAEIKNLVYMVMRSARFFFQFDILIKVSYVIWYDMI
jgi:hypothetical protein